MEAKLALIAQLDAKLAQALKYATHAVRTIPLAIITAAKLDNILSLILE